MLSKPKLRMWAAAGHSRAPTLVIIQTFRCYYPPFRCDDAGTIASEPGLMLKTPKFQKCSSRMTMILRAPETERVNTAKLSERAMGKRVTDRKKNARGRTNRSLVKKTASIKILPKLGANLFLVRAPRSRRKGGGAREHTRR